MAPVSYRAVSYKKTCNDKFDLIEQIFVVMANLIWPNYFWTYDEFDLIDLNKIELKMIFPKYWVYGLMRNLILIPLYKCLFFVDFPTVVTTKWRILCSITTRNLQTERVTTGEPVSANTPSLVSPRHSTDYRQERIDTSFISVARTSSFIFGKYLALGHPIKYVCLQKII